MTPPERWNFARDVVDRFASEPDRPALLYQDEQGRLRRFGFGEMARDIHRFAHALERLGVERGDRLVVLLPPIPAWQIAVVGALAGGVIAVPTSIATLDADAIAHRLRHSEAVAIVATPDQVETVERVAASGGPLRHRVLVEEGDGAPASLPPGWLRFTDLLDAGDATHPVRETAIDEPALLLYTSGTTGPPKAVLHTHAYPFAQGRQAAWWHGLRPDDRFWPTTGWAKAAFVPWSCGAEVVVVRAPLEPIEQLRALERLAPEVFCAPPTQYRRLVKLDLSTFRAPRLRECVAAGEPLNPEVIDAWQGATGLVIRDGYGQSEVGLIAANAAGRPRRRGSMGRPLPGLEVDVIDETGRPRPPGEEGELVVRRPAPGLFEGYWRDPEATARAHHGDWYRTGDRVRRDEDGFLSFVGRADDVIVSGGERIGPFEIESRLVEHPDVVESAAVAAPDAERGHVVEAWVVLRPGIEPDDALRDELRGRFPVEARAPARFVFVDALPKTATGKILRRTLREAAATRAGQDA